MQTNQNQLKSQKNWEITNLSKYLNRYLIKSLKFLSIIILSVINIGIVNLAYAEEQKNILNKTHKTEKPHKTIGISQIIEHNALDAVRLHMIQALKERGYEEGKNLTIIYDNAQGNMVTSTQIAAKLMSKPLDLVVGISTPSAQALLSAGKKQDSHIPIVFTAVSDYKVAGLDPNEAKYPITGITDAADLNALIKLFDKTLPKLQKLGVMYNPSEPNSVSTVKRLKDLLSNHYNNNNYNNDKYKHIQVVEVTVNKTSEVSEAVKSLIGKVDALYFPQDNTMVAAMDSVLNTAMNAKPRLPVILPIYTDNKDVLNRVTAAIGYDYNDVGRETGELIADILDGKRVDKIVVRNSSKTKVYIND